MEISNNTRAIVFSSQAYRENDLLVFVFSLDFGLLRLIARGAKKINSKMAGHLEPMSLVKLMIVKGRGLDYVGGVLTENALQKTKEDLNKIFFSGKIMALFFSLVKEKQKDERLFLLLSRYLLTIDSEPNFSKELGELFFLRFSLSFLKELGYCPEMNNCISCKKKLIKEINYFDLKNGGVVCYSCLFSITSNGQEEKTSFFLENEKNLLKISNNAIILIRHFLDVNNKLKLKINKSLVSELTKLIEKFINYIK